MVPGPRLPERYELLRDGHEVTVSNPDKIYPGQMLRIPAAAA